MTEFIAPPADEPKMTVFGDADLGGIDVTSEYLNADAPEHLASVATGTPSWENVYSLAKKQISKYAKGRVRENVNMYTQWYYGNNEAEPFCFIGISWTLAHAGGSQSAGLALIGGKKAYVPYIRNISGYHSGHSGMKSGAITAVSSFNHIGFCVAVGSSTFDLLSFNSTSGGSDDAVTIKRYSLGSASGYVNLKYAASGPAPTPKPVNPNAYPGTIYKYTKGHSLMTGSHVKWIQTQLGKHGHKVTVDGQFGPATSSAVKAFQKAAHLTADGEVGPKTWAALAK